ncbi:serine protease [Streptomyces antibioticus]|uniref:S1 family peptidase n=1 Tax=Streptomyces antibioticus TaxID=1890 RepID=UPI0033AA2102
MPPSDVPTPQLTSYSLYSPCLLHVATQDESGEPGIGTAFHIGDGYLVTARHVIEGRRLTDLVPASYGRVSLDSVEVIYPYDPSVDLAVLKTDFSLDFYMESVKFWGRDDVRKVDHIRIGGHLDDWIDDSLVLTKVIAFGYPPIPTSPSPKLVAVRGEINAIIDPYVGSRSPLFIISPMARGGFSGGPVLTEDGWLVGVVTSSLLTNHAAPELGYGAALSVEPLWHILFDNEIFPASNADMMFELRYGWDVNEEDFPFSAEKLQRLKREEMRRIKGGE